MVARGALPGVRDQPEAASLPDRIDILIAGSGAAGLVAALTASTRGHSVLLVEAGDRFGGTSALSGGRVWIPPATGDPGDAATEYLSRVFGNHDRPMIDAFVATAGSMARFVEALSVHRFVGCPAYPDYHPDMPGATKGGRAFDAAPVTLAELVPMAADIHVPPGYLPITHGEWEQWRFPGSYDWDLIESRRRDGILTNGASLVAGLIDGSIRSGTHLVKRVALESIALDQGPGMIRATVGGTGWKATVEAGAVILATGGFDADPELRQTLLPEALAASASVPTNTGIALRLARTWDLEVANLSEGWWMPMVQIAGDTVGGAPYPRALVRERGMPHQIAVNRNGERFVDEACPYHEFAKAMHTEIEGGFPNREAWLIFDEQFRQRYAFPGLATSGPLPSHISAAPSIDQLADQLGIDSNGLRNTVVRWNEDCAAGRDLVFGRGDNLYDRYYGDHRVSGNPNLGSVDISPFYAVRLITATIGSKGGPVTTVDGECIGRDGQILRGLYAAGNAAAFWTGDGYPGPGATLGIGMTFAYRAALAAGRLVSGEREAS